MKFGIFFFFLQRKVFISLKMMIGEKVFDVETGIVKFLGFVNCYFDNFI